MGNLSTPDSVQKLRTALHAKAKAEPGYRFYALYDKISREDILAHAYAQCRSNQGAPGVDRQGFEAVGAYGVERWLGELALALRQETYRPEPIRRVFYTEGQPQTQAAGHLEQNPHFCERPRFGPPGCALNGPTWSPVKGSSARVSPNRLSYGCPTTIFLDPRNRHRHHLSATLLDGRAGNGWARLLRCGRDRSDGGVSECWL